MVVSIIERMKKRNDHLQLIHENANEQPETLAFTDEELESISGLCEILQTIRSRILREGMTPEELRRKIDSIKKGCYSGRP